MLHLPRQTPRYNQLRGQECKGRDPVSSNYKRKIRIKVVWQYPSNWPDDRRPMILYFSFCAAYLRIVPIERVNVCSFLERKVIMIEFSSAHKNIFSCELNAISKQQEQEAFRHNFQLSIKRRTSSANKRMQIRNIIVQQETHRYGTRHCR